MNGAVAGKVTQHGNDDSLWNVFNRVQEGIIRGGMLVKNIETGNHQHARAVTSISENVRINKALWSLQEDLAARHN